MLRKDACALMARVAETRQELGHVTQQIGRMSVVPDPVAETASGWVLEIWSRGKRALVRDYAECLAFAGNARATGSGTTGRSINGG